MVSRSTRDSRVRRFAPILSNVVLPQLWNQEIYGHLRIALGRLTRFLVVTVTRTQRDPTSHLPISLRRPSITLSFAIIVRKIIYNKTPAALYWSVYAANCYSLNHRSLVPYLRQPWSSMFSAKCNCYSLDEPRS